MAGRLAFVPVVALALASTAGCGSTTPTSPSPTLSQLVISASLNPASVPASTAMTLTASGCTPADGFFLWTAAGGTITSPTTGASLAVTTALFAGTYTATVAGAGCSTGTLTYTIPTSVPPTTFTYTMAGMPNGWSVQVSLNFVGQITTCGGASSNGQMVCVTTLTPGRGYITDVTNAFTGQEDCKGLTASNGTFTTGGSTNATTGCPVLFVR